MLPFRWGLLGVALLIALTHGASINSAASDDTKEYADDTERSKRSYKRGQTQSQYLNFGQPELDGKAEAEATEMGSRSTVAGAHGMGQAQSQFSSGDCSGCGVGSPIYEYSTGSPDPLTLSGNVSPYSDGKPSSIIGLPGAPAGAALAPAARSGFGLGTDGAFAPGVSTVGQVGRPGVSGDFAPSAEGSYGPGTSGAFAPGRGGDFGPGAGRLGQAGKPDIGIGFAPGSRVEAPGTGSVFTPTTEQVGKPRIGGAYTPGVGGTGQVGETPGISFGPSYGPGGSMGQLAQPGAQETQFGPGDGASGVIQQIGPEAQYGPGAGDLEQQGAPGTQFGPSTGIQSTGVGKISPDGMGRPGQRQPQRPRLIAPSARQPSQVPVPGQQPAANFGSQMPIYGTGIGQTAQTDSIQPGSTQRVPTGAQQVPQYGTGVQTKPIYGVDGRQPTGTTAGQQVPSYFPGHPSGVSHVPGQQETGQKVPQPSMLYRPSTGYAPGQQPSLQYGPDQQGIGYPKQAVYAPGAQPGTQFTATGPQQILQQPGTRPTTGYRPEFGIGIGQQTEGAVPHGSQTQLGAGFVQPSTGVQQGYIQRGTSIQPGVSEIQQVGVQPGYAQQTVVQPSNGMQSGYGRVQPSNGFVQPGTGVQQSRVHPGGGLVQPSTGTQQGGVHPDSAFGQPVTGYVQPRPGVQPGVSYTQPEAGIQQGGFLPSVGLGQTGTGIQPSSAFGPQISSGLTRTGAETQQRQDFLSGYSQPAVELQPGAGVGYYQQTPTGRQQGPGYLPGSALRQPGTTGDLRQPATPQSSGFGQQVVSQPGVGQQIGVAGQYPGGGYTQPGAGIGYGTQTYGVQQPNGAVQPGGGIQRGAGVQQRTGVQPGAIYGTGYGDTYAQSPSGGQPGVGYGQPGVMAQYGPGSYEPQGTRFQPDGGIRQPEIIGPGVRPGYSQPSGTGITQYGQGPQQIVQPGSTLISGGVQPSGIQQGVAGSGVLSGGVGGADDAFSQAESSIGNGQAAASAEGKKNGGTAKTQVQGTYSSSGSFSASAMTSDSDRSASSQVTGGVEGAMSQSQGQGGAAQSQAQVQINEKTGGTKASSQTGGIIHQSQSEVQANDKGGLADAQSSGPGQTSSQAQIGFRPGQDGDIVRSAGGGQASAQSGIHSGNSQSQIQGISKYGVSYHGAAQSASGTKEQVATYREQNRNLFNTISQFGSADAVTDRVDTIYNPALTSESDIPDLQLKTSKTNKEVSNSNKLDDDDSNLPDVDDDEEPYDEYEDEEDYYNENPIKMDSKDSDDKKVDTSSFYRTHTQTTPTQTQQVAVADPTKKYKVVQNQNGRIQTYPLRTTTETLPNGFRGTVNIEKKFHTKSLEPHKSENKLNITADEKIEHQSRSPDSYVTVTKSVTGSMDNSKNPPQDKKKFQSTFYTKSSTCGYFTFSCNIVYGANGRSKICRPKAPTNGKC